MLNPEGRCIMVSGANRGIGLAVARRLHSDGYTLSAGARDVDALKRTLADVGDERISIHRYDAEDAGICKAWVNETIDRWGRIDGLVNVAGVLLEFDIEDDDETALDLMWAVNVKAPLRMTRFALPHLRRSGSGRIVNLASLAGKRVRSRGVGYPMSKFAVMAMTHATRHTGWEDGVRATAVCPSWVATDLAGIASIAAADMTQPDDLACLIAKVLSLPNNAAIAELLVNCSREDML